MLSLSVFVTTGLFGEPAYAQRTAPAPEITRLSVDSDDGLLQGAVLTFTVEGTPRGKASVRISRIEANIPLKEVSRGVYEGRYTIKRKDRINGGSTIRANLKLGNRSTSETYGLPPELASAQVAPAAKAAALRIDRFSVVPVSQIEPGAELQFTMSGSPGAKAYFTIEGVVKNMPMQETGSGQYAGRYTIRRLDQFPSALNIFGTLEANGQSVGARLDQPLIAGAKPPIIRNATPRDGETVVASNMTSISVTFDDAGGIAIDPKSVRVTLAGRDVTQGAQITPQFFNYRANLQPGKYPVVVTARDVAGNTLRHAWTFSVAAQAAATAVLPLEILSHVNNAAVSGDSTEVRGRTAPGARVNVLVQGTASIAGLFGVSQQIHDQALTADANGNFAFSFRPQYAVPGARYEITLNAARAEQKSEMKLVLFQQQ
ncbi:MAG: Ig-like domain-containing protein [Burkholderiales bacterium]|nr:Ig-like domain-containing protein [Burkholderiales bacterium]